MTKAKGARKARDYAPATIPMNVDKDIGLRELARLCFALGIELRLEVRRIPKRCLAQRKKARKP